MTARSVPIRYERDDNQAALEVRNQSIKIWCDALPAGSHPVFERFGVSVEGLRNYQGSLVLEGTWCNGNLLVPMFDRARNLANLAFVSADGQRRYLSRPHVAGTYFSVGKYPAGTKSSIVVSGGLVAALKIREELGSPVAVAFTSSNVGAVAEIMADRYQTADILIQGADGKLVPFDRQEAVPSDRATIVPLRPLAAEELPRALSNVPAADAVVPAGDAQELVWAQKLVAWAKRRQLTEFDRKMVLQAGPSSVRPVARAEAALAKLIDLGWVVQNNKTYKLSEAALAELNLVPTPPGANADLEQSSTASEAAETPSQPESVQ